MQTSLARRSQRRRNGGRRPGGNAVRSAAIALPLFLFASLAALALVGFVTVVGAYAYFSQGLTDPKSLDSIVFNQESAIYDRTGKVELARFGTQRREVVTFDQIPASVLDATTAVEDHTFWTNTGFDPLGIVSAGLDTLSGNERGASTITQQLVRQRLLDPALVQDPSRRVERKIKEIIQSIRLTDAYPGAEGKQQIITTYLNQNFYGNNNYGIKAAAENYFGVTDLSQLTLAQAAILAGIPQSPSEYDLVRNAVVNDDGKLVVPADTPIVQRRNYILGLMEEGRTPISGHTYTRADFEAAKAAPVILASQTVPSWKAPHFVWAVRQQLTDKLCGTGVENCPALERGGLKIITTLDWGIQQIAEKWVAATAIVPNAKDPAAAAKALDMKYAAWQKNLRGANLHNGALVAVDYQTGEVIAYVGSADYYGKATKQFQPQFDVAGNGWRQPGSSFKPFNYVTGINDRTMTAATMFMDVVTNFGSSKSPYIPVDADHLERGPVRLRSALQFSLNIPAVKALDDNGVTHVFEMAEKFGFRFQTSKPSAGLSLTLGTQEVHPVDEATAYGTLANGGQYVGRTMILAVKGSDGKDLITPYKPPTPQQVVSPQAAYIITNILEGNTTPSVNPIWGKFEIESSGGKHRPATLKTGTNDDARDLFAAGYIAPPTAAQRKAGQYALAVAAWNGNSDNSLVGSRSHPIFSTDSVTYEWQGFLQEATSKWAIDDFAVPNGLVKAKVDAWSGMKPGPFTTKTVDEYFIDGTQPKQVDDTKVPIQVQSGTNLLWQDGCDGSPVTKGFADFNNVESSKPPWQAADRAWAARAARGIGVAGGPEHTRTMTFYDGGFHPFGNSWGAPFPPTKTCQIPVATPFPTPSCEAAASDCPSPSSSPSGSLSPPPTKPPKKTPKPTPPPSATTGTGGTGGVGDTGGGPVPSVGP